MREPIDGYHQWVVCWMWNTLSREFDDSINRSHLLVVQSKVSLKASTSSFSGGFKLLFFLCASKDSSSKLISHGGSLCGVGGCVATKKKILWHAHGFLVLFLFRFFFLYYLSVLMIALITINISSSDNSNNGAALTNTVDAATGGRGGDAGWEAWDAAAGDWPVTIAEARSWAAWL